MAGGGRAVPGLPWLAASLGLAHLAASVHPLLYALAVCCSFACFLTGLRVVHNAYHYALGLRPLAHRGG